MTKSERKKYNGEYYKLNKDKLVKYSVEYRKLHPDWKKDSCHTYYQENKEKFKLSKEKKIKLRGRTVLQKYGVTLEQIDEMIIKQDHKCLICGNILKEGYGRTIDHNHETGKVRGILCRNCNGGLGLFRDSLAILEKAMQYLKEDR